jgi:hypothetical protein
MVDHEATAAGTVPRRILALDGGGVRGALSVAFVERMAALIAERGTPTQPARLHNYFDLVGGTSTGAIIGTALALGLPASDIKDFYFQLAPRVFRRSLFRLPYIGTAFDARALEREIAGIIGERSLDTEDLRTGLAIVMKRLDTGSAWIVTNNPRAKYWEDPDDGTFIGNRHYRLASLVRASTAAPFYFAPQRVDIVSGEPPGLFVDGGMTAHNNPALALLQLATVPAYGYGWATGAENLRIISVGTGSWRRRLTPREVRKKTSFSLAVESLSGLVAETGAEALTLLQILGRTDTPWEINSEIGDLAGVLLPPEPLFTFERFDLRLEHDWLSRELGVSLSARDVANLRRLDRAASVPVLYEIGQAAAEKFLKPEHLFGGGG